MATMTYPETVLATIRCEAAKATLDAILFDFGIHAMASDTPNEFALASGTRGTEPEVNAEIVELAFKALRRAEKDGVLATVEVVIASPTHYSPTH